MNNVYLLAGLGVILIVLVAALVVSKKKKGSATDADPGVGAAPDSVPFTSERGPSSERPASGDGSAGRGAAAGSSGAGGAGTGAGTGDAGAAGDGTADAGEAPPKEFKLDDVPVQPAMVNVSYEEVDQLAEFNVYKQYGYYDQAAESLGAYLRTLEEKPRELVWEYIGLYLEIAQIDDFVNALEEVKGEFSKEEIEEVVRLAFSLDPNNISLRVFAEHELDWSMNQIGKEVEAVDQSVQQEQAPVEETGTEAEEDFEVASGFGQSAPQGGSRERERISKGRPLVQGYARIRSISKDEVGAIAGLAPETKAAKLLTPEVDYTYGCTLYNRAIAAAQKPENIIVDAMMSDAKNSDIDNFARHLWDLYMALGRSGRDIKSTMLSWGYTLGNHPLFQVLESFPVELQLKELGLEYGYVADTASQLKAKMKPLVNQSQDKRSKRVFDKVDEVLQEAETQLQYGQVEEAIITLEEGVLAHSQEPQLYSMLFDLYERSESWSRFKDFSVRIRNEISDLPEEVAVALSHVMQRMEAGGAV